jgi:hypothetical protein
MAIENKYFQLIKMAEPINYKLTSAILLCLTFAFGILIFTNLQCNDKVNNTVTKKQIINRIDSLEKISDKQVIEINKSKESRKPIKERIVKRDNTIVEITKRKDEKYKEIIADSSNVDFIEFNRILTDLTKEYKIN